MEDLGFGQILLLLAFILVPPLIRFIMRLVRRPVESETPADEPVLDTPSRVQATPTSPLLTPRASRSEVHASQAPVVVTPLSRGRFSERLLLGNTRDVRRGIILMTILGPCRAFDPPDYLVPTPFLHHQTLS
jgi:hypothetical protein